MILNEIINKLEKKFPVENKEDWDNVGLLIGRKNKEIKKIQVSLDITKNVIENAINENVDLIISHHPLIFNSLKKINDNSLLGEKILKLIENKIAVYSMHTNLDSTKFGLNDLLGEKLNFFEGKVIDKINGSSENGIGRIYKLSEKKKAFEFVEILKKKLSLKRITVSGFNFNQVEIEKIAIVNGSGSSYWRKAKNMGADLLITGDLKYHEALDSKEEGMLIVDIGHYESEIFFYELIKKVLENEVELIIYNDKPVLESI